MPNQSTKKWASTGLILGIALGGYGYGEMRSGVTKSVLLDAFQGDIDSTEEGCNENRFYWSQQEIDIGEWPSDMCDRGVTFMLIGLFTIACSATAYSHKTGHKEP